MPWCRGTVGVAVTTWRPGSHLWRRFRPSEGCRWRPAISETPNCCELLQCEGAPPLLVTRPARAGPAGPPAPRLRAVSPSPSRTVPRGPGRSESLCVPPSQRRPHGPDRSEAPRGGENLRVTEAQSNPCPGGAEPAPAVTKPSVMALGGVRGVMCGALMTGLKNQTRELCDESEASSVRNIALVQQVHCSPLFSVEPFAGLFERLKSSDGRARFGGWPLEVRPPCLLQGPTPMSLTWKPPAFAAGKTVWQSVNGFTPGCPAQALPPARAGD